MKLYKQEGKMGAYQLMLPFLGCGKPMSKYLPTYRDAWIWEQDNYGKILLRQDAMEEIAKEFLAKSKQGVLPEWGRIWKAIEVKLVEAARQISQLDIENTSIQELQKRYRELFGLVMDMWGISIFIDTLDVGNDLPEIERIAKENKLTPDEVHALLTPEEQSYVNEWERALYKAKIGQRTAENVAQEFFWIGTDYADFSETTAEVVKEKAANVEHSHFVSPKEQQAEILRKHNLKDNPLHLFQHLAQWRDERKRLNFTAIYGLVRILREGLRRCSIPPELVNALMTNEVEEVLACKINKEKLERRMKEGILLHLKEDSTYDYTEGKEGEKEFNRLLKHLETPETNELKGMVACKGKVIGVARIITRAEGEEAKKMKEGDILITSMTRPEFVPLMKKAGAIVTDEGGISCHAAIVSRELGVPCIIGTRNATSVFKDGEKIEVDAEKGVVRRFLRSPA